jgi:hypothetical protein
MACGGSVDEGGSMHHQHSHEINEMLQVMATGTTGMCSRDGVCMVDEGVD